MEQCRQGKSAKWIRNLGKRIGSEGWARGSQFRTVGCRRTARAAPRRERVVACRPGDGLGTAPSGAFPGRRTVDSELCSECQSEEIQPSAGKRRDETTAKGTGLAESAGKEDPVELDSSPTL
ncbi:UNVERIFIED_CONTAM: hypothetical protein Scaly_3072400 [Sesamum calycinum]|uniref:Uncharacterized protein n=1 Tax=Sesamum calycinum TaxID=2727403 RepID=A0AAW2JUB0_9LAMI